MHILQKIPARKFIDKIGKGLKRKLISTNHEIRPIDIAHFQYLSIVKHQIEETKAKIIPKRNIAGLSLYDKQGNTK